MSGDSVLIGTEADFAAHALHEAFGLSGRLEPLPGEHDRNFKVTAADGARYLFKIHGARVAPERAELQAAALRHLEHAAPDLPVPRLFLGRAGAMLPAIRDAQGAARSLRLTTWLDGVTWVDTSGRAADAPDSLGRLLAKLDRALAGFADPGLAEPYLWDLALAASLRGDVALIDDPARRSAVADVLNRFADEIEPRLRHLPKQAIHGDANDRNVLLDAEGRVCGLLDFGDMVESWRINELAVAATYAALGADDPIEAIRPLLEAYCRETPSAEVEADVLYDLILTRHAISMAIAARQQREQPDNAYILVSQDALWPSLQRWMGLNRALAVARLREACGHEPSSARRTIERWILANSGDFGPVLSLPLGRSDITVLPLGADLDTAGCDNPGIHYAARLKAVLPSLAGVPFGRYGEDRTIYVPATDDGSEPRTLHLAIDLYAAAGTAVLAPLPGRVAMVGNDATVDGFGGIVVLEHESGTSHVFWTVYGHFAPASIADLKPGTALERGATLGTLGEPHENGGWPPHLHVQMLTTLCFDRAEDVIGVVHRSRYGLWESISPNPNQILGLPVDAAAPVVRDAPVLRRLRDRWLSPALSLSYDTPLKIVRSEGATLIDETGRSYLDLVNNVCHVGHAHPRVVEAIATQAAKLNTNTRYLHDNLVEYVRRLTRLLPPELSTVFFVNSGSEANDLALRLALAHSGGSEVVVLDHAYHGNLSSLIDISPYKFNGPGGAGRKRHVWIAEMPDLYRGRIRTGEADAGRRYADRIAVLLRDMSGLDRRLAAFFVEPLLGCGGQLVLPAGYLAAAFEEVRAAGGVCICDEVQIGFGRVGRHFWGFETQGVVPDIVTMGKPIGNGHPMGAVACRPEIAAAFVSGMEYFNTFGGNPVSAAAGLAVLDVIRDERLMANAAARGAQLHEGLTVLAERHPLIGDVRGLGLFMGVELVRDPDTLEPAEREIKTIVEAMKAEGILLSTEGPHHNVLKIKPPLVISEAECDRFLDTLDDVLARLN